MKLTAGTNSDQVAKALTYAYQDKPLVRLVDGMPKLQNVQFTPFCDIGWQVQGEHIIVCAVIDNLLKGASSQAMQCLNIHYGYPELTALI